MEFTEFIAELRKIEGLEYREDIQDESFTVAVFSGDNLILNHVVIKCSCESANDIRQYVYDGLLNAMYEKGIAYIKSKL